MDALIAVVGTLLGTLFGAVATYVTQAQIYRREATERLAAVRRDVYVTWLSCLHEMYQGISSASSDYRLGRTSADDLIRALRAVSAQEAQAALEHVRLAASAPVAASAAELWRHMRANEVPQGEDRSVAAWKVWQNRYWTLRLDFLNTARVDTGFHPLDWGKAGAGAVRAPQEQGTTSGRAKK